jgi:hypothetical protein
MKPSCLSRPSFPSFASVDPKLNLWSITWLRLFRVVREFRGCRVSGGAAAWVTERQWTLIARMPANSSSAARKRAGAQNLLEEFPDLERDDLRACLEFAAQSLKLKSQHLVLA